jgi:hypothetical protein
VIKSKILTIETSAGEWEVHIFSKEHTPAHVHLLYGLLNIRIWLMPQIELDETYRDGVYYREYKTEFEVALRPHIDELKAAWIKNTGLSLV